MKQTNIFPIMHLCCCSILKTLQYTYKTVKYTFQGKTNTYPSKSNPSEFISNTYYWFYGKYQFTATLKVKNSDYDYYRKLPKTLLYERYVYHLEGHRYFMEHCATLDADAQIKDYVVIDLVNYQTTFVQSGRSYISESSEYK